MIGPPTAVAVARDSSYALVTACQKFEDGKLVPDDLVEVVDLSSPANPKVIQTAHAGPGATGVSISPDGRLVLVASTGEDAISVFSITGKTLAPLGKVPIDAKSGATDVVFAPDGKTAFAVERARSTVAVLAVDGAHVTNTGRSISTGRGPYGAVVTPDGRYLINNDLGGANPPAGAPPPAPGAPRVRAIGTIGMADIRTGQTVASAEAGFTPEHVVLSGDGKYAAVVVANGAPDDASDPRWNTSFGLFEVFAVGDGTLTPVARVDSGHWCQGATISSDDKTFVLECAAEREFEVFHLDGNILTRDRAATIPAISRPGAISTARSR
jgi:DNA-binding beta-propeller fold protein YncE